MRAKTYKSTNNFTAPQSLSDFGIPVSNGKDRKYIGLEEFNFCDVLRAFLYAQEKKQHVAYVPCFSSRHQRPCNVLKLFFLDAPGRTIHYATLYNVSPIQDHDIRPLRTALAEAGLATHVRNSPGFINNYGNLFQPALEIWDQNFQANQIVAPRGVSRFVVNVFYESIEFHIPGIENDWSNLKKASVLFYS